MNEFHLIPSIAESISFQTFAGVITGAGAAMTAALAALWRSLVKKQEKIEDRLSADLQFEKNSRIESDKEVKQLISKVGTLEGKTGAYEEVKGSLTEIESLSKEVLSILK
tara:strand:+ start:218 stop:547 length:330 start_codon:yes stop_codon:yes gene_type:complete